jgi:hypothetical protein
MWCAPQQAQLPICAPVSFGRRDTHTAAVVFRVGLRGVAGAVCKQMNVEHAAACGWRLLHIFSVQALIGG